MTAIAYTRTRRKTADPFTLDHFRWWAKQLILDNRQHWKLEPFQEAFVEDVFAGIPECWLVVPEGNGKTTLVAGLALYHCEFTDEAVVAVAASSRDQAIVLYKQAEGFIRRSGLMGRTGPFFCLPGYRTIRHRPNNSFIQIYAADAGTGDGIIPTLAILDELHRHKTLDLYLTWSGKLDKRAAQVVTISTAGEPGGEFESTRERIRQMAETVEREETFLRALSETTVLHEWAVPEDGDPENLELVAKANPYSGLTIEKLRRKRQRPTMTFQHWCRFTCNLPTRGPTAAVMESEWDAARTDEQIPEGEPIATGLDVAWKWDTTAVQPLWLRDDQFRLLGDPIVLEPPRDGTSLDPNLVEAAIYNLHARNPIHTVVMDMTRAEQLAEWIRTEIGAMVIDRSQGNALQAEDYESFMEALRHGWLKHTGDPVLRRHVLNAIAKVLPGGKTRFARPAAARRSDEQDMRVIDALTAAAMVHNEIANGLGTEPMTAWG